MLLAHWLANGFAVLLLTVQAFLCARPDPSFLQTSCRNVTIGGSTRHAGVPEFTSGSQGRSESDRTCQDASGARSFVVERGKCSTLHVTKQDYKRSAGMALLQKDGIVELSGNTVLSACSSLSSAATAPRGHSFYTLFSSISSIIRLRRRRSTLTRYNPGHALPQVHLMPLPSAFGVKFHKCAQVKTDTDPPQLTFFLLIHNMGPVGGSGTNLFQVAIRDSISRIVPVRTEGKMVEKGYQMFAIDSLSAGSKIIVNYTAHVRSHTSEVLELPAFLTFSNTSQNDVSMFGPLTANLTLRVNSTDRIYPNHGVHFAGFVVGFFVTLILLSLGFLAMNLIGSRTRLRLFQQRRKRDKSNTEYADCNVSETIKDEASFEDKMVDTMVLEDPQNMAQALENLEMSTLLRATSNLEATRVQIYKDVLSSLLSGLGSRGHASVQTQERLLSVLHGQLLGMEGRLKEQRAARMAALAAQCNHETREEMEAEHHREAAEKATAELLCQHADQQELLRCSVLLEKLHKLSQSQLQLILLVRHEEASAKVQRQIIEWRRVELHKIFSEELEEATRMGELEKSTARSLLHDYFECQGQLEEVLDVVLANQRFVLAERHAQRKFLVHSLHSLNSLISDTFSSTSRHLNGWFAHIQRGSVLPAEQITQLQEKAQKEVLVVRQRLDEALTQEKRAMRCELIKKRRELISDTLRVHRQREKELSALSKGLEGRTEVAQHLQRWQNLLTAHSLELADLINNLDEEAAADIRKVIMRLIQSAVNEVKAIQPSAAQDLLALLPPGKCRCLPELEAGSGGQGGQGGSALLPGQEKLHQEGQAALRTLSSTRESLREAMERELQEQRELRAQCRAFFSCLCSSQSSLCEDDCLRMKLEFQKCLSVMDRCLVLPHAVSRAKIHSVLAARRKESEEKIMKIQSKGKTSGTRLKTDTSDLLLFQKRLDDRIRLFEEEKEMENIVANKVMEEMQTEREDELLSQADSLAMQMASLHYQKAERRTRVLETSHAVLTLHGLLMEELRERKSLKRQDMAHIVGSHCSALEEAAVQIQKEWTEELDGLAKCRPAVESSLAAQCDGGQEATEEEKLLGVQQECRMTAIVQEALSKRDEVVALLTQRLQEKTSSNQAAQDLNEQMTLKRLHANCDQDLAFASQLVKQSRASAEVLLEVLRLLLPTLPEGELLSVTDALCPKQHPPPSTAEQEQTGCSGGFDLRLSVKLRADVVRKVLLQKTSFSAARERPPEKWPSLMEKLLPRSCEPTKREAAAVAVAEKRKEDASAIYKSEAGTQRNNEAASESRMHSVNETPQSEAAAAAAAWTELNVPTTGERLFVFRCPPESCDSSDPPKRKKKRNFLNLRKGSVAPRDLP